MRYASDSIQRASAEQDLGRAFRYKTDNGDILPTILVSTSLYSVLAQKHTSRTGSSASRQLLQKRPDANDKMKQVRKNQIKEPPGLKPKTEFDTEAYRVNWEASSGHFDHQREEALLNNPRRFLLMGLPQVGKTGAYLHAIYKLWTITKRSSGGVEPDVTDSSSSGSDSSSEEDDDGDRTNLGLYPVHKLMDQEIFDDKREECQHTKPCDSCAPRPGKYGDPKVPQLWKHYTVEHMKPPLDCTSCNDGPHPTASETSKAAAKKKGKEAKEARAREDQGSGSKDPSAMHTPPLPHQCECTEHSLNFFRPIRNKSQGHTGSGATSGPPVGSFLRRKEKKSKSKWGTRRSNVMKDSIISPTADSKWGSPIVINFGGDGGEGQLHLQIAVRERWFSHGTPLMLKSRQALEEKAVELEMSAIHFPICMPSRGRAFPAANKDTGKLRDGARLNLASAMGTPYQHPFSCFSHPNLFRQKSKGRKAVHVSADRVCGARRTGGV
jgi:hypothetical protein